MNSLMAQFKNDPEFILEQIKYDLACEIKNLMKQHNITKEELAKRMNVSVSYINKILSGEIQSLRTLSKILLAINSNTDIILSFDNRRLKI